MSPVTTAFDRMPSRVRNIFICSGVVFCASSRMMNESLNVRPRTNASGATSIVPRSASRPKCPGSSISYSASYSGSQVRIDLLRDVAGQEAEPLPRFDGRTREDDALDLLVPQRLHRHRDGEVGLAGAGRADRRT